MESKVVVLNNIGGGMNVWVDRLPEVGETVRGYGFDIPIDLGKGGNVAAADAILGVPTAIIGKLGCDIAGDRDTVWLSGYGVDCEHLIHDKEATTGQGIGINELGSGRNMIIVGETSSNWLTLDEIEQALTDLKSAEYFVTGFEIKEDLVLPASRIAHELGMKVALNLSPLPKSEVGPIPYVDYLFVNEIEAQKLLKISEDRQFDPEKVCRDLQEKYQVSNVIVTLGAKGFCGIEKGRFFSGKGIELNTDEIADTCGAGDGFLAAVVANLYWGKGLEDACIWANKYSARAVTIAGTILGYSTKKELEEFCKNHGVEL